MQDQTAFENFLSPIGESGFTVSVVLSDKQRGLVPAIAAVFPAAKHALCQSHYLTNIADPIATADDAIKVTLRKQVRSSIGQAIRAEQEESPGVLTVTGLLPTTGEVEPSVTDCPSPAIHRQHASPSEDEKKRGEPSSERGGRVGSNGSTAG
jgi:hypothetical protein